MDFAKESSQILGAHDTSLLTSQQAVRVQQETDQNSASPNCRNCDSIQNGISLQPVPISSNFLADLPGTLLGAHDTTHLKIQQAVCLHQESDQISAFPNLRNGDSIHDGISLQSPPVERPNLTIPLPFLKDEELLLSIDANRLQDRVRHFQNSIIGRFVTLGGANQPSLPELRTILQDLWGISGNWRMIPLGQNFYNIHFTNGAEMGRILAQRLWSAELGVMCLMKWERNFNPYKVRPSFSKCWVRVYELPVEYWEEHLFLGMAFALGTPIRVDKSTLNVTRGHFARMLIEIDFSKPIAEKIQVVCDDSTITAYFILENPPSYCEKCVAVGHDIRDCGDINMAVSGVVSGELAMAVRQGEVQLGSGDLEVSPGDKGNGPSNVDGGSIVDKMDTGSDNFCSHTDMTNRLHEQVEVISKLPLLHPNDGVGKVLALRNKFEMLHEGNSLEGKETVFENDVNPIEELKRFDEVILVDGVKVSPRKFGGLRKEGLKAIPSEGVLSVRRSETNINKTKLGKRPMDVSPSARRMLQSVLEDALQPSSNPSKDIDKCELQDSNVTELRVDSLGKELGANVMFVSAASSSAASLMKMAALGEYLALGCKRKPPDDSKKIRKPKAWKHTEPLTNAQLMKMREEFWDTAPHYGGRIEIWDALRVAAEADLTLAQAVVDSAGVIVQNPDLTICYDERGAKYELPKYVLSEPTNLIIQDS